MAALDVRAIRKAVAEALSATGARVYDYLPEMGKVNLPALIVSPVEEIEYHKTMGRRGGASIRLPVSVVLGRIDDKRAQEAIDAYCSYGTTESVPDAITADVTLGGLVGGCLVREARTFRSDDNFVLIDFILEVTI